MKLFILTVTYLGASSALDQNNSPQHFGKLPYRPFRPSHSWPQKQPAPYPHVNRTQVIPKVKSAGIIGLADDRRLNRDSCGSVRFGDRALWTCRDTQLFFPNGSVRTTPLITSTASWSDYDSDGGPLLQPLPPGSDPLRTIVLRQYGQNSLSTAFFPVTQAFCGDPSGGCWDGTRYALWPDLPPMVAQASPYSQTAYTWIRESHIRSDLSEVETNPATTLYRVNYHPRARGLKRTLPLVTILDQQFWKAGEISFGNYGTVVRNGTAYLYGQAAGITALAKVPVSQVENRSAYQYWVDGIWTSQVPVLGQDGINITNANVGGQGTYYYSESWQSYVWIGSTQFPTSSMWITTSPNPEGPWVEPINFFNGVDGNYSLAAYSIQAHPGLTSDKSKNEIYITYTKNDLDQEGINVYSTPLVHVVWDGSQY